MGMITEMSTDGFDTICVDNAEHECLFFLILDSVLGQETL